MPRPPAAAVPRSPSEPGTGRDEASRRNRFTALALDRCDARRNDGDWLAAAFAGAQLVVVDFEGRIATDAQAAAPWRLSAAGLDPALQPLASFLGCRDDEPWFALPAEALPEAERQALPHWLDLRRAAAGWSAFDSGLFAYAKALLLWQTRARFCGSCGAPTASERGGHARRCSNSDCRLEQYPRTDPAIIVLVTHGERALLGRQPGWPERRYSTLAGFLEPGESLEDAVRREIAEEAGIVVGACRYHSSQPWPFPASLMIGFRAEAETDTIRTDDELEHAFWIDAPSLLAAVADGRLLLPSRISVSYRLVLDWLLEQLGTEAVRAVLADA